MRKKKLQDWKGKVIGGGFGLLAGPFGLFLGVLIGHVFDVFLHISKVRAEVRSFLDFPEGSPLAERGDGLYVFACLAGSLRLAAGRSPKAESNFLVDELAKIHSVTDEDLRHLHELFTILENGEAIPNLREHAEVLSRRSGGKDLSILFDGLSSIARSGEARSSGPLDSVLGMVASSWGLRYEAQTSDGPCADSWQVLGLEPGSSREEVKRVFRVLASQFHPDGGAVLTDVQRRETEEAFKRIKDAYDDCMKSFSTRGG